MEENIKVQAEDTQKVEYLDKAGLDLLWTKVKGNTQDQVEVERDRAVAKENDITDTLNKKIDNLKFIEYDTIKSVGDNEKYYFLNGKYGISISNNDDSISVSNSGLITGSKGGSVSSSIYGGRINTSDQSGNVSIFPNRMVVVDTLDKGITIKNTGISLSNGSSKNVFTTNGGVIDTSTFALKGELAGYAKKTELPEAGKVDDVRVNEESVVVNKIANIDLTKYATQQYVADAINTDHDTTNVDIYRRFTFSSGSEKKNGYVRISNEQNNNPSIEITSHTTYDDQQISAASSLLYNEGLSFTENDRSISIDGLDASIKIQKQQDDKESVYNIITVKDNEIKFNVYDYNTYKDVDYMSITRDGISLPNGSSDIAFTTDGGTIDLSQYAKKSEITTGGNVDDVQINGASVVSDKVANIKLATKDDFGVIKVGNGLDVKDGVVGITQDYALDQLSYGVEWDTTVANPVCTRIGNPLLHKSLPIQSKYKGCLVKNGKVNYYLDPNDWSKKADGSASVLDGTDGDVMVHIPKFYGKSGSNGDKRWVRISSSQIDSTWVEIPEMFVSAYRITVYSDSGTTKVASVVNTSAGYRGGTNDADYDKYLDTDKFRTLLGKPITYRSRAVARTNAKNSGQELLCYEFYKWIFYWAYVIEYANFNQQLEFNSNLTSDGYHQGGLGPGLTSWDYSMWTKYNENNPLTPCGYTNELGNFSGVKSLVIPETKINNTTTISTKTLNVNRWRGFENPFGDIWTNLDGIVLKRNVANSDSNVYTTIDSSKFGDDVSVMDIAGTEIAKNGYIKEFNLGETGEIIPLSVGASGSTYKCNYHWCNASSVDNRTLMVGGYAGSGGSASMCSFYSGDGVDVAYSYAGFRSVIRA